MRNRLVLLIVVALAAAACRSGSNDPDVLRLATTTSTADSGLLEALLPGFESQYNARVDVIAVGTGQALSLGEAGDADVVLVHARDREDVFVAEGHGTFRSDVMYNDFVLVGPIADPAGVLGMSLAADALNAIAAAEAPFASRGDDSGTHTKELGLWEAAGVVPDPTKIWYQSLGQGMGATLQFANETGSYTLTDRGTFLAQRATLSALDVMVGGTTIDENADPALLNPYGVIPVNPDKGGVNVHLAEQFVDWLTSVDVQRQIGEYGIGTFGQPLFYPDSEPWKNR